MRELTADEAKLLRQLEGVLENEGKLIGKDIDDGAGLHQTTRQTVHRWELNQCGINMVMDHVHQYPPNNSKIECIIYQITTAGWVYTRRNRGLINYTIENEQSVIIYDEARFDREIVALRMQNA